jgi:hypothetical protein
MGTERPTHSTRVNLPDEPLVPSLQYFDQE